MVDGCGVPLSARVIRLGGVIRNGRWAVAQLTSVHRVGARPRDWSLAESASGAPVAHSPTLPLAVSRHGADSDRPHAASPPAYIYPDACRDPRRTCSSGPPPAPAGIRRRSGHLRDCTVYSGLRKPAFRQSPLHATGPGRPLASRRILCVPWTTSPAIRLGGRFTRFSVLERQQVRRRQPW